MAITPYTNQSYLTDNGSSVYSLKQATNKFFSDFAKLSLRNKIFNGYFNLVTNNVLDYWTDSGSVYEYSNTTRKLTVTLGPNESLSQNIINLNSGDYCTAAIFCTSSASGCRVSVSNANSGQLINVNENQIDNVYTEIPVSTTAEKSIIQFKLTDSPLVGNFVLKIENKGIYTVTLEITKVLVYNSLIEMNDLMEPSDLDERNIIKSYIRLNDIGLNRLVDLYVVNEKMYFVDSGDIGSYHDARYDGITVNRFDDTKTYYVQVVNGDFRAIEITQEPTTPKIYIQDKVTGTQYSFAVSGAEVFYLKKETFVASENIIVDNNGNKNFLQIENNTVVIEQTDSSCVSAGPIIVNDLSVAKSWKLNITNGLLEIEEVTYDPYEKSFYSILDYANYWIYKLTIDNGLVGIFKTNVVTAENYVTALDFNTTVAGIETEIDNLNTADYNLGLLINNINSVLNTSQSEIAQMRRLSHFFARR